MDFIEDFFNISNEKYNDEDLVIDFIVVTKWLKVKKFHLKRLLIKHFSENRDYQIIKEKIMKI